MSRAIQGTYADFKIIKSRSVAQMIVEVPLEQANEVVELFGLPRPNEELWVAVAALHKVTVNRTGANEAIQRAGMLCRDPAFGKWLQEAKNMPIDPDDPDSIANGLRAILGIRSRTEMHDSPETVKAFNRLVAEYSG